MMASSPNNLVDYENFLPFPPPPTYLTVESAEALLVQWVEAAGGTVTEKM